jgi:hypothetical protein
MRLSHVTHITLSLCLAAAAAGVLRVGDVERRWAQTEDAALRLARQVATQAEGMAMAAQEKGEADPLRWTANLLSQGNEPRVLKVRKVAFEPMGAALKPGSESVRTDREQLQLEYSRVVRSEDTTGFKIQVRVDPVGFLGTPTRLQADLALLGAFVLFWAFFFTMLRPLSRPPKGDDETALQALAFTADFKQLLVALGAHVREMVRETQNQVMASSRSRGYVQSLRDRVHAHVKGVHDLRNQSRDLIKEGQKAETVALNLVIEASKMGDKGKPLGKMAEELHRYVQSLRKQGEQGENVALNLELELEPIATDADQAFHSFEDLPRSAQSLDQSIRKSTESLIAQAKLVASAKARFLGEPDPVASSAAKIEDKLSKKTA